MPQPLVTEEELQRALADPERRRSAFTTVVRLYSQQIYWQIRRMVYNHDDTDDLVQNVFIKAWEAIEGFRGEAKVSTWLYRIALYEALNFLKKRRHEEENVISPSEEGDSLYLLDRLTADEYFDADEVEVRLQKAILSLPAKQQLVFRLRYYDEMPYEDGRTYRHVGRRTQGLLPPRDEEGLRRTSAQRINLFPYQLSHRVKPR